MEDNIDNLVSEFIDAQNKNILSDWYKNTLKILYSNFSKSIITWKNVIDNKDRLFSHNLTYNCAYHDTDISIFNNTISCYDKLLDTDFLKIKSADNELGICKVGIDKYITLLFGTRKDYTVANIDCNKKIIFENCTAIISSIYNLFKLRINYIVSNEKINGDKYFNWVLDFKNILEASAIVINDTIDNVFKYYIQDKKIDYISMNRDNSGIPFTEIPNEITTINL